MGTTQRAGAFLRNATDSLELAGYPGLNTVADTKWKAKRALKQVRQALQHQQTSTLQASLPLESKASLPGRPSVELFNQIVCKSSGQFQESLRCPHEGPHSAHLDTMRIRHGLINSGRERFKRGEAPHPLCTTCKMVDDVPHLLFECPRTAPERSAILSRLHQAATEGLTHR